MTTTLPHVISLGAGVQSSTLAEMAAAGEISPMPIAAIFADTQAEPGSVYSWLDYMEKRLPFPVIRVTQGSLEEKELKVTRSGRSGNLYRHNKIPVFTEEEERVPCSCALARQDAIDRGGHPDEVRECKACGNTGKVVRAKKRMMPRMCTMDFKIRPILRKLKELVGIPRGCKEVRVIQWIGISTDEVMRMKPSREPWVEHRWPLIEKRMSRLDCIQYFEERGLPKPPRSACVFCPYHNDLEWKRLKEREPEEFRRAAAFEKRLQEAASRSEVSTGVPFLHKSLTPIEKVEFSDGSVNLFNNECEGMCGN